ncbi:MAG: hypothetical protein JW810_14255 [Sedimentisphaerales bacterium]|nr:hypothetical protein [Sedimentisphaerales bacterium]
MDTAVLTDFPPEMGYLTESARKISRMTPDQLAGLPEGDFLVEVLQRELRGKSLEDKQRFLNRHEDLLRGWLEEHPDETPLQSALNFIYGHIFGNLMLTDPELILQDEQEEDELPGRLVLDPPEGPAIEQDDHTIRIDDGQAVVMVMQIGETIYRYLHKQEFYLQRLSSGPSPEAAAGQKICWGRIRGRKYHSIQSDQAKLTYVLRVPGGFVHIEVTPAPGSAEPAWLDCLQTLRIERQEPNNPTR